MNEPQPDFREIHLQTPLGRMAGLAMGADTDTPVLCIHGWLDNAASFVPLGRQLDRVQLVAMDLPGHGHSDHLPPAAKYHFIDYLFAIDALLTRLEWSHCHLIGHSLGGAIASVYAAAAPERVSSLILLDSLGPLTEAIDSTIDRLRRSLRKSRRGVGKPRHYPSIEAMMDARRQASGMTAESARLICQRSARTTDQGLQWRSDPAINWVSSLILSEDQAFNLLSNIEAPTLIQLAADLNPWEADQYRERRLAVFADATVETIEGSHHFHMDSAQAIANSIHSFIRKHHHEPQNDID